MYIIDKNKKICINPLNHDENEFVINNFFKVSITIEYKFYNLCLIVQFLLVNEKIIQS